MSQGKPQFSNYFILAVTLKKFINHSEVCCSTPQDEWPFVFAILWVQRKTVSFSSTFIIFLIIIFYYCEHIVIDTCWNQHHALAESRAAGRRVIVHPALWFPIQPKSTMEMLFKVFAVAVWGSCFSVLAICMLMSLEKAQAYHCQDCAGHLACTAEQYCSNYLNIKSVFDAWVSGCYI